MDIFVSITAQYLIFVVALIAFIATVFSKKIVRNNIIKLAILSALLAFLLAHATGTIYYNPRPFVVEHVKPLFPYSADNGFPSEHTLFATVIAGTIFFFRRNLGIFLGILGILIGAARVIAGVHHPIDIVGGIAVAIFAIFISWIFLRIVDRNFRKCFQRPQLISLENAQNRSSAHPEHFRRKS
jgi:undecaprenyl-diphosphatase